MKSFKKILRLLRLIVFIVLVCIGVGLGGGVPIPLTDKKRNRIEMQTDLPDEDASEAVEFKIRK